MKVTEPRLCLKGKLGMMVISDNFVTKVDRVLDHPFEWEVIKPQSAEIYLGLKLGQSLGQLESQILYNFTSTCCFPTTKSSIRV